MPSNVNFQVPWIPQEGITQQVLGAIQLANEHNIARQQLALQQQGLPSTIAEREAQARRLDAQTELDRTTLEMRRQLINTLTGGSTQPGGQPGNMPTQAPSGALPAAPATAPKPEDFKSGADYLNAVNDYRSKAPFQGGGLIGQTVNNLLNDSALNPTERQAIKTAGQGAMLKSFLEPDKALDGVVSTYNDILRQRDEAARAIKVDTEPDAASPTGHSQVARNATGSIVYQHPVMPEQPKTLDQATANLGEAMFNANRESTPGTKAALKLAQTQHDAMYQEHLTEVARQARATAVAQGRDYEAMIRTGENPITREKLTLSNAPPGALANPATGEVIPQDMISLYRPTQNERQTADTARQVLAISQDLKNEITKNPELIGPLSGRSQQGLQKIGIAARDASRLIDDVTFLQSAATKMHTGRFSSEILNKMSNVIKPGMSQDEFLGSLDSVTDVAGRYANEDKLTTVYEYQQRHQFENQGAAPTKLTTPSAAPAGPPKGATMKVPGSDGKLHWSDGKVDLGVVP